MDLEESTRAGSDQEHWVGKAADKVEPELATVVEKSPTQESRQFEFDNKTMTDDHGMQLYGIAMDQNGKKFYMAKNSWGETGRYEGIWYVTPAFVKGQSLGIMLHKSALPKGLLKKMGK